MIIHFAPQNQRQQNVVSLVRDDFFLPAGKAAVNLAREIGHYGL
jgi:hypothetical protein